MGSNYKEYYRELHEYPGNWGNNPYYFEHGLIHSQVNSDVLDKNCGDIYD